MTVFLELDDMLALVDDLGVGPVRDLGLVASSAERPRASLYGVEAYPTIDPKAAALLDSVVRHHALLDGNKRLGWLAMVVFYGLNGIDLDAPDDDAYDLVIDIASGHLDVEEIAAGLARWHERGAHDTARAARRRRRSRGTGVDALRGGRAAGADRGRLHGRP